MFKAMTWNLENLFRPGAPSAPKTDALYRVKLEGLAATINAQAPDVLGVQEVGDPAALDDLVDVLDGDRSRPPNPLPAAPSGRCVPASASSTTTATCAGRSATTGRCGSSSRSAEPRRAGLERGLRLRLRPGFGLLGASLRWTGLGRCSRTGGSPREDPVVLPRPLPGSVACRWRNHPDGRCSAVRALLA